MKKRNILLVIALLLLFIIVLWKTSVIPKFIGKQIAISYVKSNYNEMNLIYNNIEFSAAYGDYIASFIDKDGNIYNFKLSSKYFPTSITYDSIKQSNVN